MSKKGAQPHPQSSHKKTTKKQEPQPDPEPQDPVPNPPEQKFTLYSLLQLEKGPKSTIDQIKKQYRKLVIVYHPDKNIGDDTAKQKFQKLKEAYDILTDPEKKKIYDETGMVGDGFDEGSFQTAYQYFRGLYKKIQKEDIEEFQKRYRNGDMEKEDLMEFYQNHQGDMTKLLECIPLSKNQDVPRFITFFEQQIKAKTLKTFKAFTTTKNKVKLLADQTEQFQQQQKQRIASMQELTLAIRNKSNKSFLDSLQQKYAPKKQRVQYKKQDGKKKGRKKIDRQ